MARELNIETATKLNIKKESEKGFKIVNVAFTQLNAFKVIIFVQI